MNRRDDMRVNNCPRCGSDELAHGYSFPPSQGSVECHAPMCGVITVAETERGAVDRWNAGVWDYYVAGRDENGNALYERALIAQEDAPPMTPVIDRGMHE